MVKTPKEKLLTTNEYIEKKISCCHNKTAAIEDACQDIVKSSRTLFENIAVFIYSESTPGEASTNHYDLLEKAKKNLNQHSDLRWLKKAIEGSQNIAGHETPETANSYRTVRNFIDYFVKSKDLLKSRYNINILNNLDEFPYFKDKTFEEFYAEINKVISNVAPTKPTFSELYYLESTNVIYYKGNLFYELTLTPACDYLSKFSSIIVYSRSQIYSTYATRFDLWKTRVLFKGVWMETYIVLSYHISIRPCELMNYGSLFFHESFTEIQRTTKEYQNLMSQLEKSGLTLTEILKLPNERFQKFIKLITDGTNHFISKSLQQAYQIIVQQSQGDKTLLYLSYHLRNKEIKNQLANDDKHQLGTTHITTLDYPFETAPFFADLRNHVRSESAINIAFDSNQHESEILAREIEDSENKTGKIFISADFFSDHNKLPDLIDDFNRLKLKNKVIQTQVGEHQYLALSKTNNTARDILMTLYSRSASVSENTDIEDQIEKYLSDKSKLPLDDTKKNILQNLFRQTSIIFLYGYAGTGKSTLLIHVLNALSDTFSCLVSTTTYSSLNRLKKLFKADSNISFRSVASLIRSPVSCDILILDECSTISNDDMQKILKKVPFKYAIFSGDPGQLPSIHFGNWFRVSEKIMPKKSTFHLEKQFRSESEDLTFLWKHLNALREGKDPAVDLPSILEQYSISDDIGSKILEKTGYSDSIVLCMNYDGLFGINHINRYFQAKNESKPFYWKNRIFKIGDPVLFLEDNKYEDFLYNNLKGKIVNIRLLEDERIEFTIEVYDNFGFLNWDGLTIFPIDDNKARVTFTVENGEIDSDQETVKNYVVPFQLGYATSIYKAQGLEYDSVKIIFSNDLEDRIDFGTFYTAVTRAKKDLHIYWSIDTESKVVKQLLKEIKETATDPFEKKDA